MRSSESWIWAADQSFSGEFLYEMLKMLRSDWAEGLASGHGESWEFESRLQMAMAADIVGAAGALCIAESYFITFILSM